MRFLQLFGAALADYAGFFWFVVLASQLLPISVLTIRWIEQRRWGRVGKTLALAAVCVLLLLYIASFHAGRIYFEYDPLGIVAICAAETAWGKTIATLVFLGIVGLAAGIVGAFCHWFWRLIRDVW